MPRLDSRAAGCPVVSFFLLRFHSRDSHIVVVAWLPSDYTARIARR
ncbi:MAG: hypothetical protein Q6373_002720 [Candidatus Sigynarchaeota archaeon]